MEMLRGSGSEPCAAVIFVRLTFSAKEIYGKQYQVIIYRNIFQSNPDDSRIASILSGGVYETIRNRHWMAKKEAHKVSYRMLAVAHGSSDYGRGNSRVGEKSCTGYYGNKPVLSL